MNNLKEDMKIKFISKEEIFKMYSKDKIVVFIKRGRLSYSKYQDLLMKYLNLDKTTAIDFSCNDYIMVDFEDENKAFELLECFEDTTVYAALYINGVLEEEN
ncbi:MAG: hypothetical protein ACOCP8_00575 [archaeon]